MKQTLQILVDFDRPELLRNIVEKLVNQKKSNLPLEPGEIRTASTEAFVCGNILIEEDNEKINLPFDGSFVFTCVKMIGSNYNLTWSSSLS